MVWTEHIGGKGVLGINNCFFGFHASTAKFTLIRMVNFSVTPFSRLQKISG